MKKAKYFFFVSIVLFFSFIIALSLLLAMDLYLHRRFESVAGFNYRGYRGKVVGKKKPRELRVVVLGGSTAFGYGVLPDETFPAYLWRYINDRRPLKKRAPVSVINLAYNNSGAYSFKYTLEDYRYLDYDVAILYEGYNDLFNDRGKNNSIFRRNSVIFRLTGYLPIFPLILREKAAAIRYGGNIENAYWQRKTTFKPKLAEQVTAIALEQAASIMQSLERQIGRLTKEPQPDFIVSACGCYEPWLYYCEGIAKAIEYALYHKVQVIVVTQPYISDKHVNQQRAMVSMLKARFSNEPRVHYVNLGVGAVDLKDRTLCYDGMHLTAKGNEEIAFHLLEQVLRVLEELES